MTRTRPPWPVRAGLGLALSIVIARHTQAATLSCTEAASVAETAAAIPPGLLLAIGVVESGRSDASGKRSPWPWSIQAAGTGKYYPNPETAIAAVQSLQAGGVQSIDIGCFQINLLHHPHAFPDLATGFDPLSNALVAARFLVSLHAEFGAWEPAVAAYHSRAQIVGGPYRDMVLASWHGVPPPGGTARFAPGFRIWGPNGEIGGSARPPEPGTWISMPPPLASRLLITAR